MNLLSKITLYACTILLTTQSYGMMAQLRLGLQKSSQSVGKNRSFSSTTFSEKMAKFFAGIGTKKDKGGKTAHPMRFRKNSTLSEEQIEEIRSSGTTYNWRQDVEEKENLPIFTNLHLAANEADDNSWIYALSNQDYSGDTFFEPMVKKILKATDVCKDDSEYLKIQPERSLYECKN